MIKLMFYFDRGEADPLQRAASLPASAQAMPVVFLDGVPGARNADEALNALLQRGETITPGDWKTIRGDGFGTAWKMTELRSAVRVQDRGWKSIEWWMTNSEGSYGPMRRSGSMPTGPRLTTYEGVTGVTDFVREGRLFRVGGFHPSHRMLFLISEATLVDRTTTRVEVAFGHVELMFLKPLYRNGLHVRRATDAEFSELSERHGISAADAEYTWMLDPDGESFVVSANPSWREAEYALMGGRESLYESPWPPEFPAESGSVS